jgi:hypothetical protein
MYDFALFPAVFLERFRNRVRVVVFEDDKLTGALRWNTVFGPGIRSCICAVIYA